MILPPHVRRATEADIPGIRAVLADTWRDERERRRWTTLDRPAHRDAKAADAADRGDDGA
jgi:hypothetical protein